MTDDTNDPALYTSLYSMRASTAGSSTLINRMVLPLIDTPSPVNRETHVRHVVVCCTYEDGWPIRIPTYSHLIGRFRP